MSFGVTFDHVLPPSRVTCTRPSSDPVQITPFCTGDSIIVNVVRQCSQHGVSCLGGPAGFPRFGLPFRVRSPLLPSHLCPSLVVFMTPLPPMYNVLGSCG